MERIGFNSASIVSEDASLIKVVKDRFVSYDGQTKMFLWVLVAKFATMNSFCKELTREALAVQMT